LIAQLSNIEGSNFSVEGSNNVDSGNKTNKFDMSTASHPKATLAAELAGSVPTAFIPSALILTLIRKAAKRTPFKD
jgi:hypothetical protein